MSAPTTNPSARAGIRLPSRLDDVPTQGVPFGRLVRAELRKGVDTRAGRWLLAAIGIITLLVLCAVLFTGGSEGKDFESFVMVTYLPQSFLLPVVGILLVTAEWSQRTGLATFTLEPRRIRVGLAKLVASWVFGVLVVCAGVVIAAIATVLGMMLRGTDPTWGVEWQSVVGLFLGQLVVISMGVAFGMILQNTPAAIVTYLLLPMVWSILGESISWLKDAAMWLDTNATLLPLYEANMTGDAWAKLGTSIAVWVVIPLAAGLWRLTRSEVK
ncbi:ABC transporter permease [Demetria terragena]|uniref:ABC transporter permease n=1 Tax=Demetria terragena TaxID=63959 RepID=UPI000371C520|nr:ABC transporter permease [Demetria terragena]